MLLGEVRVVESLDIVLFRREMGRRYQRCGSGTETDYHPIEVTSVHQNVRICGSISHPLRL